MTNPFEKLEDKELAKIGADIIESKNVGGRAESMLPYSYSKCSNCWCRSRDGTDSRQR